MVVSGIPRVGGIHLLHQLRHGLDVLRVDDSDGGVGVALPLLMSNVVVDELTEIRVWGGEVLKDFGIGHTIGHHFAG